MDNMGQIVLSVLSLHQNLLETLQVKFNIDRSICDSDKYWPKFTKWTIWINTYCPWLRFLKNLSSSKRAMESYEEYLKGQYDSLTNMAHTFAWSEFATNILPVIQIF